MPRIDLARSGDLPALATLFQAAALEPQAWITALDALAAATGSGQAQLIGIGPRLMTDFNWLTAIPTGMAEAFEASQHTPDLNYRVVASSKMPGAAVLHEGHYAAVRPLLAEDSYFDLCSDWNIPHGCQTDLVVTEEGLVGLALLRSARDGVTDAAVRETFVRVAPIARAAVQLQMATERQGHKLVAGALEAMGVASFVLDKSWRLGAMTPSAEALVSRGEIVLIDRRPLPRDLKAARRIAAESQRIRDGQSAGAELIAESADGPIRITLSLLPPRDWQLGFGPHVLMTIKAPPRALPEGVDRLQAAFGFTKAELAVARLMMAGHRRDVIAQMRGTGPETLRSQMRNIFAKLGVRREAEAIGVLHTFLR